MSDLDHAKELLEMARGDLNAMKGMQRPDVEVGKAFFSDEVFGFHAQQTAEKCFKAWIASLGEEYSKRHDLMALLTTLKANGQNVAEFYGVVDLNPYAVQYRYESLASDDEELDRDELLATMEKLFDHVEELLG